MHLALEFRKILVLEKSKWEQIFLNYKFEYSHIEETDFEKTLYNILNLFNKFEDWKTLELKTIVEIIFSQTLEMLAKKLIGENSQYPEFMNKWEYIIESLENFSYKHLEFLFTYLPNVLINLQKEKKFLINYWIQDYVKIIPVCENNKQLFQVGFVLAWKNGLAKFRSQSLELLEELPCNILNLIFETQLSENNKKLFIEFLKQNPWNDPKLFEKQNAKLTMKVHVAGGHSALNGIFLQPPTFYNKHANIVNDEDKIFQIYADFFGVSFVPIFSQEIQEEPNNNNKLEIILNKNCISYKGESFLLPAFPENFLLRTTKDSFFVVSNFTHYMLVGGFNGNL